MSQPGLHDSIHDDRLLPDRTGGCHGCNRQIACGSSVKMVPAAWVLKRDARGYFMFCGHCSMPDGPPRCEPREALADFTNRVLAAVSGRLRTEGESIVLRAPD